MIDLKLLRYKVDQARGHRGLSDHISWDQLGELLDQLESAKLDAARYVWLREESQYFPSGRAPSVVLCDENDFLERGKTEGEFGFLAGGRLDSAIDAAMAATKGEA